MILGVRVSAPGGDDVHNQAKKADRAYPRDAEDEHPNQANQNPSIVDLTQTRD
jgi:hypothetical protein